MLISAIEGVFVYNYYGKAANLQFPQWFDDAGSLSTVYRHCISTKAPGFGFHREQSNDL